MSRIHHLLQPSILTLALALAFPALAADKQRIDKQADLPRFSYAIAEPLENVVRDNAIFARVMAPVRADMESVLAKYDIADKSSRRQYLNSLMQLDFLAGNYDAVLTRAEEVRALEDKPANKLLSGLRIRAMANAAKQAGGINNPAYFEAVAKAIRSELDAMPFDVVSNDVKRYKAAAETMGEGRVVGNVRDVLQATLNKSGTLSSDFSPDLIVARYNLATTLPLKRTLVSTYTDYLNLHKVEKADMWAARDVVLASNGPYKIVNVAVWDSGVDTSLFPKQLVRDGKGKPAVIAFDLESRATKGNLFPVPAALQAKLPELLTQTKGFSDLTSNIDSPQASAVKMYMSELKAEQFKPAMEQRAFAGNYVHGTHVAGITLNGNPWARLVTARISWDYKLQPEPCLSKALAERSAKSYQAFVDYFKRNKVRVVNMSWGGTVKDIEGMLEKCGTGKTAQERQVIARVYYENEKQGMIQAFASAPEILFVAAAGNSASDASFGEFIPSSIVLPNLLTVGAVDKAGDEAPFTSYGPTVVVHANGYQVESYLPGGARVALSGTSMASPNVANLAAKLLAAKPSLKPEEVIAIIRDTADKSADGRRTLINPAKAMARAI